MDLEWKTFIGSSANVRKSSATLFRLSRKLDICYKWVLNSCSGTIRSHYRSMEIVWIALDIKRTCMCHLCSRSGVRNRRSGSDRVDSKHSGVL